MLALFYSSPSILVLAPPGPAEVPWSIESLFLELSKFVPLHAPITSFFSSAKDGEGEATEAVPEASEREPAEATRDAEITRALETDAGSTLTMHGREESNPRKRGPARPLDDDIEAFLAELPPDLGRELRSQLEFERLQRRFEPRAAESDGVVNVPAKTKSGAGPLDAFLKRK